MFDLFNSPEYKASEALDKYLERMETILRIKKMASETNEPKFEKGMAELLQKMTHLATLEIEKAERDFEEWKKKEEK